MQLTFRAPEEADWPAIAELADRSVADVTGAGPQEAWLANRRSASRRGVLQRHWVALSTSDEAVVGYVGLERAPHQHSQRIFLVMEPEVRERLGDQLLLQALAAAREQGVEAAWFIEYAADDVFVRFLRQRGFAETRRFALEDGNDAVVLTMSLQADPDS